MNDTADQLPDNSARESVEQRLAALERRLVHLEALAGAAREAGTVSDEHPTAAKPLADHDGFWALEGLQARAGEDGAVLFTGSTHTGAGQAAYQWSRSTQAVLDQDWAEHADSLAALGHPLRLAMLRRLLDGTCTVAQFVDELELGSTGVAYHHLHQLAGAGWVTSPRRGEWSIPAGRVVPLMTIIIATEPA